MKRQSNSIKIAAQIIKKGNLVLFPTETVYGIGADGLNNKAVDKIFIAKGRQSDNPLILHIANENMLQLIAKNINELERKLMNAFWPGPFTIVLPKQNIVPDNVTAGLNTVAVRMPSNKIIRDLIIASDTPIAAPSANLSGKPSGTCLEDIYEEFKDKVDYIIDGGKCKIGLESTVVKVENNQIIILRPGKITKEQLEKIAPTTLAEQLNTPPDPNDKVLSPGLKYKHYAPNTKCILVYSKNNKKMVNKIQEISNQYKNTTIICSNKNIKQYKNSNILSYGNTKQEIANNIFSILRKADHLNTDIIIIEGVNQHHIGLAIMNRLIRSCSYNYINID